MGRNNIYRIGHGNAVEGISLPAHALTSHRQHPCDSEDYLYMESFYPFRLKHAALNFQIPTHSDGKHLRTEGLQK